MADRTLRIPVLGALQAVEYGTERLIPRGLVLLEGRRLAGKGSEASRKPRAAPSGEYAPAEEAVGALEPRTPVPATFEQLLQFRVQSIRVLEGEPQLDRGLLWQQLTDLLEVDAILGNDHLQILR
jgi:hypothetical protein